MKYLSVFVSILFSFFILEIYSRLIIDNGMNYEFEMMKYARYMKVISANKEVGIEHKKNVEKKLMGAQVKNGCSTNDGTEEILKKIFNKKNYSILFLKKDFCKIKKPINYYLKNDPVHLSKQGHEAVSLILKKYVN